MLVLTTAAFSQNCFEVLSTSRLIQQADGKYTLSIDYTTDGLKSLDIIVKCGGDTILKVLCFKTNGTENLTYKNLACSTGNIIAVLTPRTGSCAATDCLSTIFRGPGSGVMPVKLSSFSAVRSKQVVSINWSTESEIDAKEFIVERAEGTEFRSAGTIPSNGNSSTKKSYSFSDKNENVGNTYYRLKNVDLNGKFTYSQIRTVKGYGVTDDVTVFPNPARSNSKISLNGVAANSSIQLIDFSGKVLRNINSNTVNSLDLSGVKNGTYLIRIVDKATSEIVNKKLTVTN